MHRYPGTFRGETARLALGTQVKVTTDAPMFKGAEGTISGYTSNGNALIKVRVRSPKGNSYGQTYISVQQSYLEAIP